MLSVVAFLCLQAHAISFGEARQAAERLAGDVMVAERRVEISRADVDVAGTLANPTVTAETARLTAQLSLGLSLPLPLFGQRATAMRAARADLEVARFDV